MPKLEGYEFWEKTLGKPRFAVAPMVDQSELPWRLLSRRHKAELCYTPMFHASVFIRDIRYRREALASCEEDSPLIVQFCANDPEIFVQAGMLAQDHCDAIDLNLGCPQSIAKRGHYGAFLQEDWELISKIVSLAHQKLSVPVTCKIRIFKDADKTIRFAQMLEKAGCQLLTVHGRTREMKGPMTGMADWAIIKAIREAVKIPVFANGNIQSLQDAERCIVETGVDGVMSAEGNLHNPAIFEGKYPPVWSITEEYLDLVKAYPCPLSYVRGHLFKLSHSSLLVHSDLRVELARAKSLAECEDICKRLRARCEEDASQWVTTATTDGGKRPHWLCQPRFRPSPEEMEAHRAEKSLKRPLALIAQDSNNAGLSKNQLKKRVRNPTAKFTVKPTKYEKCAKCANPKGLRCVFNQCRACCKHTAHKAMADCAGHNLLFKSKQEKRLQWEAAQREKGLPDVADTNTDTDSAPGKGTDDSPKSHVTGTQPDVTTQANASQQLDSG